MTRATGRPCIHPRTHQRTLLIEPNLLAPPNNHPHRLPQGSSGLVSAEAGHPRATPPRKEKRQRVRSWVRARGFSSHATTSTTLQGPVLEGMWIAAVPALACCVDAKFVQIVGCYAWSSSYDGRGMHSSLPANGTKDILQAPTECHDKV
jgi:hypothetical protein